MNLNGFFVDAVDAAAVVVVRTDLVGVVVVAGVGGTVGSVLAINVGLNLN